MVELSWMTFDVGFSVKLSKPIIWLMDNAARRLTVWPCQPSLAFLVSIILGLTNFVLVG